MVRGHFWCLESDFKNQLLVLQLLTRTKIANCAPLSAWWVAFRRIRVPLASAIAPSGLECCDQNVIKPTCAEGRARSETKLVNQVWIGI